MDALPNPGSRSSFRSLAALQASASTSRVLNLMEVARAQEGNGAWAEKPLFKNRVLNASIVLKHRIRADEMYMFNGASRISTKVIIPFSRKDLALGGQSLFVGTSGWRTFVAETSTDFQACEHDLAVMAVIESLPSLDPFLLRERLRREGFEISDSYFALSAADVARMQSYVSQQIQMLVRIATERSAFDQARSTTRMVEALLSTQVDERLDPLGRTLMMEGDAFREGVFCWKGFLYYKWSLSKLTDDLNNVVDEMAKLVTFGPADQAGLHYFQSTRARLLKDIRTEQLAIRNALKVYDDAFHDLTENGQPTAFRTFLMRAPEMFLTLGEKIGAIQHIASFWRYRFPAGRPLRATLQDAMDLVGDFEESIGSGTAGPHDQARYA